MNSENRSDEIYMRYYNLAINRFTWENLPLGLTSRIMEENLINHGMVMMFKTKGGGLLALPCKGVQDFNVYFEPTAYNVFGNRFNKNIDVEDGIVIRNNATGYGDRETLLSFSEKLNEVEQTMDVNLFQQNTPYIVLCDEKERLTFKNIFKQVKEFKLAIYGRKGLSISESNILNTKSDYLLDKLQSHKLALTNELLTFLGINNNNIEKKERLITDEVNANNDFVLVNIDHMYDERKKAVDEINVKFGTKITVKKREVEQVGEIHEDTKRTGGEQD